MARPLGSENKDKPFKDALRIAICDAKKNPKILRRIADKLLGLAAGGDISAIKEVADRLDGKTVQGVEHDGEVGLTVKIIRFNKDGSDTSKPVGTPALSTESLGLSGKGR